MTAMPFGYGLQMKHKMSARLEISGSIYHVLQISDLATLEDKHKNHIDGLIMTS